MAKIQGKYLISAPLYVSGDDTDRVIYTYTNNDRNASVSFPNHCDLDFIQLDPHVTTGIAPGNRRFLCNAVVTVNRARIFTPGSPGVYGAEDNRAARLVLSPYANNGGGPDVYAKRSYEFRFDDYNEWYDFGTRIEAFELEAVTNNFWLRIPGLSPSFLTIDDYNLQSAYESQKLYARLEMEIDTAGMWDPNAGAIV